MTISTIVLFVIIVAGIVGVLYSIWNMANNARSPAPVKPATNTSYSVSHDTVAASFPDRAFYPSDKSPMAKTLRNLRVGMVFVLIVTPFLTRGSWISLGVSMVVALLFMLIFERMARRRMRTDQPAVSLTQQGIESSNFTNKLSALLWQDIASVAYEPVQGTPYLKFQLWEAAALPGKRNLLATTPAKQPMLMISPLSPQDQETLLVEIQTRLASFAAGEVRPHDATQSNEIRETREFNERLEALEPNTWLTHALIAINVLIWLWALTAGATVMQTPADKLLSWGGNAASEVQRGEWWRLFSAMFLHSGAMHILMNMFGLYSAGVIVERVYGRSQYLLIYLGAGLLGSAASLHYSAQQAVSVGASGAVFGITGALLVGFLQHRDKLPKVLSKQMISGLGLFIIYALIQGFGKQGIDNAAHIGGLLGGCLLAYILPERFDLEHYRRNVLRRFAAGLVLASAITTAVAIEAPRASLDMSRIFASEEIMKRGIYRFSSVMKELQQLPEDVKAGKLTEWEADARGRSEYAPKFQAIVDDLRQVVLRPTDPRHDLLKDTLRISELMAESLAMISIHQDGTDTPKPENPERMAQIETEIRELGERLQKDVEQLNKLNKKVK